MKHLSALVFLNGLLSVSLGNKNNKQNHCSEIVSTRQLNRKKFQELWVHYDKDKDGRLNRKEARNFLLDLVLAFSYYDQLSLQEQREQRAQQQQQQKQARVSVQIDSKVDFGSLLPPEQASKPDSARVFFPPTPSPLNSPSSGQKKNSTFASASSPIVPSPIPVKRKNSNRAVVDVSASASTPSSKRASVSGLHGLHQSTSSPSSPVTLMTSGHSTHSKRRSRRPQSLLSPMNPFLDSSIPKSPSLPVLSEQDYISSTPALPPKRKKGSLISSATSALTSASSNANSAPLSSTSASIPPVIAEHVKNLLDEVLDENGDMSFVVFEQMFLRYRGKEGMQISDSFYIQVSTHTLWERCGDTLPYIFSFLSTRDLISICLTCREWRALAYQKCQWNIDLSSRSRNDRERERERDKEKEKDKDKDRGLRRQLSVAVQGKISVSSLSVSHFDNIRDNDLLYITEECPRLKKISFSHCDITDESLIHLVNLASLEELRLDYCFLLSTKAVATVLQSTSLRSFSGYFSSRVTDEIFHFVKPYYSLRQVSLRTHFTDQSLAYFGQYCPNLEQVVINCPDITDQGLIDLVSGCKKILDIDLSYCSNITDAGIKKVVESNKMLKKISLAHCDQLTISTFEALGENCPDLVNLNFSLSAPYDRRSVKYLAKLKKLEMLDLTNTHLKIDEYLEIAQKCISLKHMVVPDFISLLDLTMKCKYVLFSH
eukprot:TRINITY_DN4125_c0_g1_i1.p1 TRINITY_DN4125_c0_g1~~TRINITY_DN4125_c0_g1_i1.p1  ORF type:complete len:714 (+),score=146.81 TRINITY_DN4125_c0_g1_i1:86-2227(+)